MYKHHEESIEIMKKHLMEKEETIALVFGGSVAKGTERPDSDLDAMVIITDDAYAKRVEEGKTTECIFGMSTYEGGYFDVKYMSKAYIQAAAQKGSEPTRNSFIGSKLLFSKDPEIEGIVKAIPVFQESEMEDKLLSFYANFALNYHYFWNDCKPEAYMKIRTGSEIILSVYRILLQENKKLFQCNRRLEEDVEKLGGSCAETVRLGKIFSEQLTDQALNAFVEQFEKTSSYVPPEQALVGSRYLADFEQWWLYPRPLIAEW